MGIDDINRPTASELAKEDFNRSLRNKDSAKMTPSSQQAGRQVKEKSAFEKVFENFSQSKVPVQAEEARKFDAHLKEVLSDENKKEDEGNSSRQEEKSREKKKLGSDSEQKETSSSKEGGIKDRVLGKQTAGDQKSGSGGGAEGQGSSSKQFSQRQFKQEGILPDSLHSLQKPGSSESVLASRGAEAKLAGQISKQVLDQIVQFVRIGLNKNLDQEMQVDLSEKIFRGLSLKVSSHQGKIAVTFLTGNPATRRIFEKEKNKIAQSLKEKNIQVSHIQVQFLG